MTICYISIPFTTDWRKSIRFCVMLCLPFPDPVTFLRLGTGWDVDGVAATIFVELSSEKKEKI